MELSEKLFKWSVWPLFIATIIVMVDLGIFALAFLGYMWGWESAIALLNVVVILLFGAGMLVVIYSFLYGLSVVLEEMGG